MKKMKKILSVLLTGFYVFFCGLFLKVAGDQVSQNLKVLGYQFAGLCAVMALLLAVYFFWPENGQKE